jgi:Domain of unknown function (DUF6946)
MRISKNGKPIDSVASWFELAPPKEKERQWVDGHSAKELAKAFCEGGRVSVPTEVQRLLDSSPILGHLEIVEAWPEHKIPLDSFRGETRNADLAAVAVGRDGVVAVTLEAKADEPFGELIQVVLAKAPKRSRIPERVENLTQALFGAKVDLSTIRYQLVHGVAGSLVFAAEKRATAALFVVFEFRDPARPEEAAQRNDSDLQRFLGLLSDTSEPLRVGQLVGPFTAPGAGRIPAGIPLFVGKAIRQLGAASV